MRNFQGTIETHKLSFISAFSICMTVRLSLTVFMKIYDVPLAIPVDTGRKLNVHKTFNLRPVSTGMFGYI